MKSTTTLVFAIALTVTLTVTLIMKGHSNRPARLEDDQAAYTARVQPKRISRFLAANEPKPRNPNAADHCHKDIRVCPLVMPLVGRNATCCNNKCVDLHEDSQNCGACKKKCRPFEMCCGGECVNLSYDKSHCGACNNACHKGPDSDGVCVYAMCDYA